MGKSLSIRIKEALDTGKESTIDMVILFLLLMLSGGNLIFPKIPLSLVCILYYFFKIRRCNYPFMIPPFLKILFLLFGGIVFVQNIVWKEFDTAAISVLLSMVVALCAYVYYDAKGFKHFLNQLSTVLKILVVLGLITYSLNVYAPQLFTSIPYIDSYGNVRSLYQFGFILFGSDKEIVRLCGYFWEPGIFQIYLNIFILLLLPTKNYKWLVPAVLALYFTKSTAGFLIFFFIVLFVGLKSAKVIYKLIFILFASLAWAFAIFNNVNDKFAKDNGSSLARMADIEYGLQLAKEHPIVGIGGNTNRYLHFRKNVQMDYGGFYYSESNNTNGLVGIIYCWGIPFAIIYMIGLVRQRLLSKHKLVALLLLLISLSSEPLAMTPFFLLFAYTGLSKKRHRWSFSVEALRQASPNRHKTVHEEW